MRNPLLRLRVFLSVVIFSFVAFTFFCSCIGRFCPPELKGATFENPIVTHGDIKHNYLGIQQILSNEDQIYILHQSKCIISVFETNGHYKYTVAVYDHQNGRAEIAIRNNQFYIKDKADNIYIFENDSLKDFVSANAADSLIKNIDFSAESKDFFLRGASIYKKLTSDEALLVVERPAFLVLMQHGVMQPIRIALILLGVVVLPKKRVTGAKPLKK